jgi:hypothetical protein
MIQFFLNTRLGQTILLAVAISAAIYATYRIVDSKAYSRGYDACQSEWNKAKATAAQQAREDASRSADTSAGITGETRQAAQQAVDIPTITITETKEVIRHVYRDPPQGAPARFGGCAYPVDQRVQQRFEIGVDQARAAAR